MTQKRFLSLLAALAIQTIAGAFAQLHAQQNTDGIAAIVNGAVITFSDVKKQVQDTERMLVESGLKGTELVDRIKEVRLDALRALIERQLIIQEFENKKFFMPENIVEDQINDIIKDKFDNDRSAFIKTLKASGKTLEQFKKDQRENLVVMVMRQKNVAEEVIVSPYKIEQYYQQHAKEFTTPDQVKLSLIFFKRALFNDNQTGADTSMDSQKILAHEVRMKLDAGADFGEMAKSYSEGARKADGGDWGWVSRDTLRKELADVAFTLFPGQISDILETDDGYYILKVSDTKRASIQPIDEVRDQIEKTLTTDERRKLQEEWLNGLKAKAYIKMF